MPFRSFKQDVQLDNTPLSDLRIELTSLVSTSTVVRGFNSTLQITIQITNTNDSLDVIQLNGIRENFHISAFLPNTTSTYHMVDFRLVTMDTTDSQQGLGVGISVSMVLGFEVLVSREACSSYTEWCTEVTPGLEASYEHPLDYEGNVKCLAAASNIQCNGKCGISTQE